MSRRLLTVNPGCESEDDSIVYGDQTTTAYGTKLPERGDDSQPTQYSQPVPHSAPPPTTPTTRTPRMIMTREERRKRRRRWREHREEQLLHEPHDEELSSCSTVDDEADDEDDETLAQQYPHTTEGGAFASLQALLQDDDSFSKMTKQRKTQNTVNLLSPTVGNEPPRPTTAQDHSGEQTPACTPVADENIPMADVHHKESTVLSQAIQKTGTWMPQDQGDSWLEPSPPDFAVILQDDDFGEDDAMNTNVKMSQMKHSILKEHHKKNGDRVKRARSSAPPTSNVPIISSPSQKKERSRRHSSFHAAWQTESTRSLRTQQDDSNIVGLRPTHWRRPILQSGILRAAAEQSQMARMKVLRAVTSRPAAGSTALLQQRRSQDLKAALTKENLLNNTATPKHSALKESSERITTEKLRSMTFRPPSMPKNRNEPISNPSYLSFDDEDDHVPIQRPTFSSPPPPRRHRSSKSHGPWTKRLHALKSNQANDAIKLQHAGMNRRGVSFDLHDPRRKAKTYTDVTILGQEDCYGVPLPIRWQQSRDAPCTNDDQHKQRLLTVLCHIHNHGVMNRGNPASSAISKVFAWISFTRTTARNVGLQRGLELRLYNAILLPMRSVEYPSHTENGEHCSFIVICTQLCERHPEKLDPVFQVDTSILALENESNNRDLTK